MVNAYKEGRVTPQLYTEVYERRMSKSFLLWPDAWKSFSQYPTITILCYCPADGFCHRYLLADLMVRWMPELYVRGVEI